MKAKFALLLALFMFIPGLAHGEMIAMHDFNRLTRGMSAGEVLYRVGNFDYESVYSGHYNEVLKRIWYYIPKRRSSNAWITEITFDHRGNVSALNRYRARK